MIPESKNKTSQTCLRRDLNARPLVYKTNALTPELQRPLWAISSGEMSSRVCVWSKVWRGGGNEVLCSEESRCLSLIFDGALSRSFAPIRVCTCRRVCLIFRPRRHRRAHTDDARPGRVRTQVQFTRPRVRLDTRFRALLGATSFATTAVVRSAPPRVGRRAPSKVQRTPARLDAIRPPTVGPHA